jgi:hypothetical protein
MEMGMNMKATGDVPPKWAILNNARQSRLITKVNLKAADGEMAFQGAQHPEDKGVTLTDDERAILVRSIDLGGQYYSRQNTGFTPFNGDPVAPGLKY